MLTFRRCAIGPGLSVVPVRAFLFPAASSHLPKVCGFPAFSAHLPKVRNRSGPSVAPVPAFSSPAASSHLPKVCSFSAFFAHLPKVCNRPGTLCSACTRVFVSSRLLPPSEGVQFFRVFCSPSEGVQSPEVLSKPKDFPPSYFFRRSGARCPAAFPGVFRVASGGVWCAGAEAGTETDAGTETETGTGTETDAGT